MSKQAESNKSTYTICKLILALIFSANPVFAETLRAPCESLKPEAPLVENTDQDLSVLRAQGLVGELETGYVEARDSSVQAAVDKINLSRKEIYQAKAEDRKINIVEVELIYAKIILNYVPTGTWIKINERWSQKE